MFRTMNISKPKTLGDRGDVPDQDGAEQLSRRDQDRARLRAMLLEGAASEQGMPATDSYFEELRDRVRNAVKRGGRV